MKVTIVYFETKRFITFTLEGVILITDLLLEKANTPQSLGWRKFIARYQKPRLSFLEALRMRKDLDGVVVEKFG